MGDRRIPMRNGDSRLPGPPSNRPLAVRLREWVVAWWRGESGGTGRVLRTLTLPLEAGFRYGTKLRNRLYDSEILPLQRAPVPVVSVGNLTVGGSGKTPFSAWLARELRRRGEKPALVARGYGEDEMVLHRRWNPDCLILAQEDRAYGAWRAAKKGASVVVLDDGFQHRRLARDLDIVLVAASTPFPVRLLPRGPYREALSALERAALVIITQKGSGDGSRSTERRLEPYLGEAPLRVAFRPGAWMDLEASPVEPPEDDYLAVCGIGDPEGFARTVSEAAGRAGELLSFPDHHDYSWSDVKEIRHRLAGRPLVTTEKDAVKLQAFGEELPDLRVLHLDVEFLSGEDRLWQHLKRVLTASGSEA